MLPGAGRGVEARLQPAPHFMHGNFCLIRQTLKMDPTVAASTGVIRHPDSIPRRSGNEAFHKRLIERGKTPSLDHQHRADAPHPPQQRPSPN
jgi:hypothetical protein